MKSHTFVLLLAGIATGLAGFAQAPIQLRGFLPLQDSIEIVLRKDKDMFWSGTLMDGYFEIAVDSLEEGEYLLTWLLPTNDIERWPLRRDREGQVTRIEMKATGISKPLYIRPQEAGLYTLRMNGPPLPEDFARRNRVNLILSDTYGLTVESVSPASRVFDEIGRLNYWYRDAQRSIQDSLFEAGTRTDKIPMDFYRESIRLNDSLNQAERVERSIRIAESNPEVVTSLFVILQTPKAYLVQHENRLRALLDRMSGHFGQEELFTTASARLRASTGLGIGDQIPAIVGQTPEGAEMDPLKIDYDLANYTLLEFWAAWCGPCRAMNPEWNRLLDTYGIRPSGKTLQIVGVSLDTDRKDWLGAIEKDSLQKWIHISDLRGGFKGMNATSFGIDFIPFNLLLDERGQIIRKNIRPRQLEALLED